MMASVRAQLEQLDAKIALWQQYVDTEEDPDEPIDLNIDDLPFDMSFVQEENVVPEQEAEVKANINEQEVKETVHNFLVSVVQMAQVNCYESEALNNALSLMLGKHITTVEN